MMSALLSPSLVKFFCSALVLPSFTRRLVEHDDAAVLGFGRKRVLERQRAHLLRQTDRMAARRRPERTAAAAEQVDLGWTVTGRAGALLPIHLLAGAVDLGAVLDVMGAALALGELPDARSGAGCPLRGSRPKIASESSTEPAVVAVERHDLQFHVTRPPALVPGALPQAPLGVPADASPAAGTCRASARPSAASSSPRRAA